MKIRDNISFSVFENKRKERRRKKKWRKIMKEGYIIDYVSGLEVRATPEEVQAVQVFAKTLV